MWSFQHCWTRLLHCQLDMWTVRFTSALGLETTSSLSTMFLSESNRVTLALSAGWTTQTFHPQLFSNAVEPLCLSVLDTLDNSSKYNMMTNAVTQSAIWDWLVNVSYFTSQESKFTLGHLSLCRVCCLNCMVAHGYFRDSQINWYWSYTSDRTGPFRLHRFDCPDHVSLPWSLYKHLL